MHIPCRRLFVLFIIVAGLISCENQRTTTPEQRYYYFPKVNTYYDVKSLEYIYSLDSARTWVKMKAAEDLTSSPVLGERIAMKETTDDIWYENEMHRNRYGGALYNVITRDTVLLVNANKTDEVKKEPVKPEPEVTTPKKKRNIFQKIFGKKKE